MKTFIRKFTCLATSLVALLLVVGCHYFPVSRSFGGDNPFHCLREVCLNTVFFPSVGVWIVKNAYFPENEEPEISYRIILPFEYDWIGVFHEGLSIAEKNGKMGVIDTNGDVVVGFYYDRISPFSEGLAATRKDGKVGFIDTKGNVVIPFTWDDGREFGGGLAPVGLINPDTEFGIHGIADKWGFIDTSGDAVIPLIYRDVETFRGGLAALQNEYWEMGVINMDGCVVVPFGEHEQVWRFTDKLFGTSNRIFFGLIDLNGNMIMPPTLRWIYPLSVRNTNLVAAASESWQYGIIDTDGNIVIPFEYNGFWHFCDEFIGVHKVGGCYTLIGWDSRVIASFREYKEVRGVGDGRFFAHNGDGWGLIDFEGNEISAFEYDIPHLGNRFSEGLITVVINGKLGFIDAYGNTVIPFEFDYNDLIWTRFDFTGGLAIVRKDGKWGIIDRNGNSVVPFEFEYYSPIMNNGLPGIRFVEENLVTASRDNRWGLIQIIH